MTDHQDKDLDPTQSTRDWIDLKLASLRSEMRLLFVVSVAGNQLLGHLSVGTAVAAAVGGGAIAAKVIAVARLS